MRRRLLRKAIMTAEVRDFSLKARSALMKHQNAPPMQQPESTKWDLSSPRPPRPGKGMSMREDPAAAERTLCSDLAEVDAVDVAAFAS